MSRALPSEITVCLFHARVKCRFISLLWDCPKPDASFLRFCGIDPSQMQENRGSVRLADVLVSHNRHFPTWAIGRLHRIAKNLQAHRFWGEIRPRQTLRLPSCMPVCFSLKDHWAPMRLLSSFKRDVAEHGHDDEADSTGDARGRGPDEGIGRPSHEHERSDRASVERPMGEHRWKAALCPEGKPAKQGAQRHAQAAHRENAEDGPAGVGPYGLHHRSNRHSHHRSSPPIQE